MVSEVPGLRADIAEPVEREAADNDRDVGTSGSAVGVDERITRVLGDTRNSAPT